MHNYNTEYSTSYINFSKYENLWSKNKGKTRPNVNFREVRARQIDGVNI